MDIEFIHGAISNKSEFPTAPWDFTYQKDTMHGKRAELIDTQLYLYLHQMKCDRVL